MRKAFQWLLSEGVESYIGSFNQYYKKLFVFSLMESIRKLSDYRDGRKNLFSKF